MMMACPRCRHRMKQAVLDRWYGFQVGVTLTGVRGHVCPACGRLAFTRCQADELEARAERLNE